MTLRDPLRTAAACLVTAGLFAALAWIGVALADDGHRIAPIWLANALLVGVLLRNRNGRALPLALSCFLANVGVNVALDLPTFRAVAFGAMNIGEALGAAWAIRRWAGREPDLGDLTDLVRFTLVAGIAAPLLSGLAAAVVAGEGGFSTRAWLSWSATDALGMVIGAPIVVAAIDGWRARRRPDLFRFVEGAAVLGTGWICAAAVFAQTHYSILFLVGPLVLFTAFRMSTAGVAAFVAGVTAIGTMATAAGSGPVALVNGGMNIQLLILQLFFATIFVLGLPVGAVLNGLARARRQLREAHDFTDSIVRNLREVVFRSDAEGRWTFLNPAWERISGRPVAQSLGQRVTALIDPEDFPRARDTFTRMSAGEITEATLGFRVIDAAGRRRHIEASVRGLWTADGRFDGATGNVRDVTEAHEADEARRIAEADLATARDQAEAASRAKASFLAHMSHEIRTPMNGVLGFTELLLAGDLQPEQRKQVRMLAESGHAMMRLLNDILDLSKIEAGQLSVAAEPTDLRHAVRGCMQLMVPTATRKALSLECRFDDDVPALVLSDDLRVRQIVLNLLGNAVKFTATGSVEVHASMREPGTIAIEVRDSGIGIAPDRLRAVFEPFAQADAGTARRYGGTGLGLTISRDLAGLLGGRLEAESEPGRGSRFTLVLPAIVADPPLAAPAAAPTAAPVPARGPRVLLAEDHEINQLLTGAMLEKLGCRVEIARDGVEAVALASAGGDDPFTLVLMDVQMPHMDGLEAARHLRAHGLDAAALPIVALTANAYPEDVATCLRAGMQGHLSKPVQMAALADTIARWTATTADAA